MILLGVSLAAACSICLAGDATSTARISEYPTGIPLSGVWWMPRSLKKWWCSSSICLMNATCEAPCATIGSSSMISRWVWVCVWAWASASGCV